MHGPVPSSSPSLPAPVPLLDAFQRRVLWLVGLAVVLVLMWQAQEALLVGFLAFIAYSALLPFVQWLEARAGQPRAMALVLTYTALLGVLVLLVLPLFSVAQEQLLVFLRHIPEILDEVQDWVIRLDDRLDHWRRTLPLTRALPQDFPLDKLFSPLSLQGSQVVSTLVSGLSGATVFLSKALLDVVTALIISTFLLKDREAIGHYWLSFFPRPHRARLADVVKRMTAGLGGFVNGQVLMMLITGTMTGVGLTLLKMPFALLLGLCAGLLTAVPMVGANLTLALILLVAFGSGGGWPLALWVFGLSVVVQALENNVWMPLVYGRTVGLHPLAILGGILVGGMVFGFSGVLLAIPAITCLNVLLDEARRT
jgi:predicted PurR-regulated permease PerM